MTTPLVLVVEDDHDVGEALADLLRELGWSILLARNGEEALRILHAGTRPDVILLDLMMPGMDGFEFRARQQADPALAHIPVVVLTAVRGAERAAASLSAAALVAKPADVDELLSVLARVAGRVPPEASPIS